VVKRAAKDYPEADIKKGEKYYWWKFRFGGKHISKTEPRRSQLTQSSFLSTLWDLEDTFVVDEDDPASSIEELKSQLEDMKSECESSLDNMADHLRETSSSGQTLQERIDGLDQWISDLDSIDTDIDEDLSEEEKNDRIEEIKDAVNDANPGLC
jgi:chromosome segregation ATPase